MQHRKLSFMKKLSKVCEKDLSCWIRIRRFCAAVYYSDLRNYAEVLMILAYLILSSQVDFRTLQARSTAYIPLPHDFFRHFVYAQAGFFAGVVTLGAIANCGPKDISAFLTDPQVVMDVVLIIKDLADMNAINSLNALRIIRLVGLLMRWQKMDSLREVVEILKRSLVVTVSIIGVLLFCYLFLGMVMNNFIVSSISPRTLLASPLGAEWSQAKDFIRSTKPSCLYVRRRIPLTSVLLTESASQLKTSCCWARAWIQQIWKPTITALIISA